MNDNILVLGLGNVLLQDEGAGVHVIRELSRHAVQPSGVTWMDGGTLSFTLSEAIEANDGLIVVDAAELGAEPGAMQVYRDQAMDAFVGGPRRRSVHEVSLLDVLATARLNDRYPVRRALIGIQPGVIDWGEQPAAAVARSLPKACECVMSIIAEWRR